MTLFIDCRAGSEELILYPPFCFCPECGRTLRVTRKKAGRITKAECPTSPLSHAPLGVLADLAKIAGTGRSSADVHFSGHGPDGDITVGVELKKISDLVSSLESGRLVGTQIPSMLSHYDVSWLLVYGACRPNCNPNSECYGALQVPSRHTRQWRDYKVGNRKKPFPYSYAERFMAGPSLTWGRPEFRCYRVMDISEAAWWIAEVLYATWQKKWSDHKSFHQFDMSADPGEFRRGRARRGEQSSVPARQRQVAKPSDVNLTDAQKNTATLAARLPGVGYERAIAVARHFKTPEQMVRAGRDEWSEIVVKSEGKRAVRIGKVRAEQIVRFLKGA